MTLPKREYNAYKFVLNYAGERYMSLVSVSYSLYGEWHKHFDHSVDPVYLENGGLSAPFYRTKGVIMSLTETNITVALTPRAYKLAVDKLSKRANAKMTPDVPLRHAERELAVFKAITGDAYVGQDIGDVHIFQCDKSEFLSAYQDGTFRATMPDNKNVLQFDKDDKGVFWASFEDKKFVLCSTRCASLVTNKMTLEEFQKERHGANLCDKCGKPGGGNSPSHPKCANCGIAHYCSPRCQRADWAQHKKFCKTYK